MKHLSEDIVNNAFLNGKLYKLEDEMPYVMAAILQANQDSLSQRAFDARDEGDMEGYEAFGKEAYVAGRALALVIDRKELTIYTV